MTIREFKHCFAFQFGRVTHAYLWLCASSNSDRIELFVRVANRDYGGVRIGDDASTLNEFS